MYTKIKMTNNNPTANATNDKPTILDQQLFINEQGMLLYKL